MVKEHVMYDKTIMTVIVASMNSSETLQQCIDSFVGQTYRNKELIVIDGASIDGSEKIIRKNNQVISYWVSEKDRGIAHAWNKGLERATGEWVLFLGADDVLASATVLDDFSKKISEHSLGKGRIVYGEVKTFLPGGEHLASLGMDWPSVRSVFFSEKMMIPHPGCFHHCSVFKDFGVFDENYHIGADYEFLLRVLKKENAVFLHGFTVANMAFGGVSSRISTLMDMQNECDNALRKNGFKPKGCRRMCNIIIYSVLGFVIKYAGERIAASFLDVIRIVLGRKPVWTRK